MNATMTAKVRKTYTRTKAYNVYGYMANGEKTCVKGITNIRAANKVVALMQILGMATARLTKGDGKMIKNFVF